MPITRNTLSEDELYMLDQLESGLRSKYGELSNDKKAKLDAFEAALNTIPTAAGRKYAISRLLNTDKDFDNPDDFPKLSPELWSVKNQEDYTPPDVEKSEAKRDAEEFWNWDSPKHWTKRNTNDLKRRADDAGYADYASYLNDVRDIQTEKDREKIYDENAMPGTKLLYPRMTEKVLQGKDIEGEDFNLDMIEQVLYAGNPAERLLGLTKFPTAVIKWGGAVANPLTMETADAIAYNGEDTDRAKFSPIDVTVGTLINRGVEGVTDKLNLMHRPRLAKETETPTSIANREKWLKTKEKKMKQIDDLIDKRDMADVEENLKASMFYNDKIDKLFDDLIDSKPKREFVKTTKKDYIKNEAKNLVPNAIDFAGNKFGDVVSEDPKRTKRFARRALGPAGLFVSPAINDIIDSYYESDNKNKEKKRIDDLIYGLEDWRE